MQLFLIPLPKLSPVLPYTHNQRYDESTFPRGPNTPLKYIYTMQPPTYDNIIIYQAYKSFHSLPCATAFLAARYSINTSFQPNTFFSFHFYIPPSHHYTNAKFPRSPSNPAIILANDKHFSRHSKPNDTPNCTLFIPLSSQSSDPIQCMIPYLMNPTFSTHAPRNCVWKFIYVLI